MAKRIDAKVTSSNKRERTITITCYYDDGTKVVFKSYQLSKEDFHYYRNHATYHDILQFLKTGDYYEK